MYTTSILSRLKRAVKKVTFLLNFSINRWRIASMIGAHSIRRRQFSFNDRPGLRSCTDDYNFDDSVSWSDSSPLRLSRTTSSPLEDDVDQRADVFIANFHRQLRIERQISLELQYCRGNSFNYSITP
ncbi:hypothetical protein SLA2020_518250 [Shorea laevis]